MGNSTERVPIKDLSDLIYYKQVKEITDAEFETSRDLNREIKAGRIIVLEQNKASRGSEDTPPHQSAVANAALSINDLKAVMREMLPEFKGNGGEVDLKGLVPFIQDAIRSEMAKMPMQSGAVSVASVERGFKFKDLSYVPEVSTEGLESSINIESKSVDGQGLANSLELFKKLKNKT